MRCAGGCSNPMKYGVICCMPAVVSRTVGSLCGTRDEAASYLLAGDGRGHLQVTRHGSGEPHPFWHDNGWRDRTARGYRTNPALCQTAARQATRRECLSVGDGSPGLGVLFTDRNESLDQQNPFGSGDSIVRQIG